MSHSPKPSFFLPKYTCFCEFNQQLQIGLGIQASLFINLRSQAANLSSSILLSSDKSSFSSFMFLTTLHLQRESHIAFFLRCDLHRIALTLEICQSFREGFNGYVRVLISPKKFSKVLFFLFPRVAEVTDVTLSGISHNTTKPSRSSGRKEINRGSQ